MMAWYVSLTLRWTELRGDLAQFFAFCRGLSVPATQIRVPEMSWHSTVYAIAKIVSVGKSWPSMRDGALAVLGSLRETGFIPSLGTLPAFRLRPSEVQYWTSTTSVQFDVQGDRLSTLRTHATECLRRISISNIDLDVNAVFPMVAPEKNVGSTLFGSIARMPGSPSDNRMEQVRRIAGFEPGCFLAEKLILTVSDDSLTNDLCSGVDFEPLSLHV